MWFQILNLLLELLRLDQIIGVKKLYVLARRVSQSVVLRRSLSGILLPQKLEARVLFNKPRDLFGGIVRRTIVHDDAFPVCVGLCAQALKRLADKAPVVISRHDDADQRLVIQSLHLPTPFKLSSWANAARDAEMLKSVCARSYALAISRWHNWASPSISSMPSASRAGSSSSTTRPHSYLRKYHETNESRGAWTSTGRRAARYSPSFVVADVLTRSG